MRPTLPSAMTASTRLPLIAVAGLLLSTLSVNAALVDVISDHDGNGNFTYSVIHGGDPYMIGGASELLSFSLHVYNVIDTVCPPGWTCNSPEQGFYTWTATNPVASIVGSNAVVFGFQSAVIQATSYNEVPFDATYAKGVVVGELYSPGSTRHHLPSDDSVAAVNIAAQERFTYVGPVVPEPAAAAALAVAIAAVVRARGSGFSCGPGDE